MKKLAFLLIAVITLTFMTGCDQKRKDITRFTPEKEEEVIDEEVVDEVEKDEVVVEADETDESVAEDVEFAITTPQEDLLETDKGYHLIQGTASSDTETIVVNDYTLTKYKPGSTEWSYVAAVSLGTLSKGENSYNIRALDAEGNELASENFTIVYDGIDSGSLISTGNHLTFALILTIFGMLGLYSFHKRFQ